MPDPPPWRVCLGSRSPETFDFGRRIGGPWKVGSRFVNMGRMLRLERIQAEPIWEIPVKHGYNGYMSAQYEGKEDAMTGVPKLIGKIKVLCRKYSSA
jgi:hypothetical protein